MNQPASFSVLMACYAGDRPEQLAASISSVTSTQTRRPEEVVLVVDGPIPASLQEALTSAAEASPVSVRLHRLARNGGLGPALDAGLALCRNEIVARQDADDLSRPDRFAVQVPVIEAGADLVGSALQEFTNTPGDGIVRTPPLRPEAIVSSSRFHQPVFHPTVVYRRSAVQAAGGYEHVPSLEDYWLFARMIAGSAVVRNVADPLVDYRIGGGAYARRGGTSILRAELDLQRRFRRIGFTSRAQFVRNVAVRGGYRLVPTAVRRTAYRLLLARRGDT